MDPALDQLNSGNVISIAPREVLTDSEIVEFSMLDYLASRLGFSWEFFSLSVHVYSGFDWFWAVKIGGYKMRDVLAAKFEYLTSTFSPEVRSIGVIGGSINEPELQFHQNAQVSLLGIASNEEKLDLNVVSKTNFSYDLVICNQVLEHVWNHGNAFDNLAKVVRDGGWLWLTMPASTFPHGAPEFFLAGMTKSYVVRNLTSRGFQVLESGQITSRRDYFSRHIFRIWLSSWDSKHPLKALFAMILGNKNRFSFRKAVSLVFCSFIPEDSQSKFYAVETYCLTRKKV